MLDPDRIDLPAFELDAPTEHPLHWLDGDVPLVSTFLLETFVLIGIDNYQTFPATLQAAGGPEPWPEVVAFNVAGLVDVVNLDESKYELLSEANEGPPLFEFEQIVLDATKVGDLRMFRLVQDPSILLVSAQVMRALELRRPPHGWGFDPMPIAMI